MNKSAHLIFYGEEKRQKPWWCSPHPLHREYAVRRGRVSTLGSNCFLSPALTVLSWVTWQQMCTENNQDADAQVPLSCEPAATQFLSVCRTPEKDRTTTNTDPTHQLIFRWHYTAKLLKQYLFVQLTGTDFKVRYSVVCYFFSINLSKQKWEGWDRRCLLADGSR